MSSLARRAREGLRQAYLQQHLQRPPARGRCQAAADRFGAWTRGGLSTRDHAAVRGHLAVCAPCRGLAAELADVADGLAQTAA
ncbi:zf-HC2 domain-containing protein [Actinokineospora sp. 24-640]